MKSKKKGKNLWRDHYTDKAQKAGFPARSVFKLEEMQKRWKILRPGQKVLDLGCAPGSWLKYASQIVGDSGRVIGLDLKPMDQPDKPNAQFIQGDAFELTQEFLDEIGRDFDVVLSDMAPNTTGIKNVDALKSAALCESALATAITVLKPGGSFVCKIFQGEGFDAFIKDVKKYFTKHKIFKPESTRKQSREIYVVGWSKKGGSHVRT
ncbi:23S rRNA Um-2552 2'-O-methyltransferase [Desulfatibacillum alkenivorans DSM 16219]|jgi:23S rRNA (uridine2552-2'-O)-methyltransferase|uniref:Ribosomal RNA large subunit methyltransferase E n=1 Tax=Desulfatibacillum alkenivorans DSM 16219 TaxID=1121393 RepID=A0A1M6GBF6_9BACT|nr:RlmE family RNA methyltransferase [Desulfatibacillum alkenivorans]SHJ07222.1 23S rRNA Um-2552 2'-O-methyltransferase [Desulfatibacillum alkenivorans DSM 16219]